MDSTKKVDRKFGTQIETASQIFLLYFLFILRNERIIQHYPLLKAFLKYANEIT